MPTIIGGKSGTRPYLELDWSITSQDIANNRSTINLKLYLRVEYSIGYNARYTGNLQGSAFTANAGYLSSPGRYLIAQRNITVGHNSDGTKTQNFSASYNISITWGGTYYSSISLSGSGTLTPIPRGSTLSAFSFASSLQVSTANTINYTVARHSSTYRHQVQLRDGSVTIATWDNQSTTGSTSVPLTAAQVNTILGRMSTVTSKSFTLRVATRSKVNGGFIGNAVTRNANASVNANVMPVIISTSATPIGNSWAVGKGFYVQGQTGVQAEFSSSAGGGAGVRSRNISIGSLSNGGSVVGSVFRHSQSRVNSTGNITITYKITDTRGRTASDTRTVNFRAYTPPKITSFTVGRSNPTSSTVNIKSKGSIHGMGGQNTGTMTVKQQGVTSNVRTISLSNTTPSFDDSFNRTVATSASADFTITVTDLLGNSASSTSRIGTAFMEFSIRKGTGVGIGKVHQNGELDVSGSANFSGELGVEGLSHFRGGLEITPLMGTQTRFRIQSKDPNGHGYLEWYGSDSNRKGWLGIGGVAYTDLSLYSQMPDGLNLGTYQQRPVTINKTEVIARGRNGDHHWARFYDGTQICHGTVSGLNLVTSAATGILYRTPSNSYINFAMAFFESPGVEVTQGTLAIAFPAVSSSSSQIVHRWYSPHNNQPIKEVAYMAVGRWK